MNKAAYLNLILLAASAFAADKLDGPVPAKVRQFATANAWYAELHPLVIDGIDASSPVKTVYVQPKAIPDPRANWCRNAVCLDISLQPKETFIAVEGALLKNVAMYSGNVCNMTQSASTLGEGVIRTEAVAGGLNVVDPILTSATSYRAQQRSKLSITLTTLKYVGLGLSLYFAHAGDIAATTGASIGSAAIATVNGQLSQSQSAAQDRASTAARAMLDTSKIMGVSAGTCSSRLFYADLRHGFQPIRVVIQ